MHTPLDAPLLLAVALLIALLAQPSAAGRPDWMPEAPPLPVTGRVVEVSTVAELDHAVRQAHDGDTVMVADGTYQLDHLLHLRGRTNVTIRGASGDPSKVVIRGAGWEAREGRFDLLVVHGCSHITIAHLTFTETQSYGIKLENTPLDGRGLEDIQIYDCHFYNIGTRMVKGTGGKHEPVVRGSIRYCHFENTKIPPKSWLFDGDYISAIDCMRLVDWTISDNSFKNIRGANGGGRGAVFVWVDSKNVVTERNVFVGCDRSIAYGNPSGSNQDPQSYHNTGGIICNNFVVAGADKGIEICWANGVKVYHNTVLADVGKGWGIHCHWNELRDVRVAGNLVRGQVLGDAAGVTVEGNLTVGIDDAWFRDPREGDLHLTAAAQAAMNTATRLRECLEDFDGQARSASADVGADEYRRDAKLAPG